MNIDSVAFLYNLTGLFLSKNSIYDISALSNLHNLFQLDISYNNIVDIGPLVANLGIGSGDFVSIDDNPLDCSDPTTKDNISILESRDMARFDHDCH